MARRSIFPEQKEEYLGNMWGWKFSLVGLVLLILLLGLMAVRYYQLQGDHAKEKVEMPATQ